MGVIGGSYILLLVLLVAADALYMVREAASGGTSGWGWIVDNPMLDALRKPEIRHSVVLSLVSCTLSAALSLFVAVPIGYLLTRARWPGRTFVDVMLDIPIVLPPLIVGLSLLILFQFPPFTTRLGDYLPVPPAWAGQSLNRLVVYQVPAVVIAQFAVAAAFATRTMKAAFDQLNPRCEQVALALGCTRGQALRRVVLPELRPGLLTAVTIAWARSLGEFGPLLIFAGATRNKTEVLSTTVFLELSIGNLGAAVAVSLIMVLAAALVLVITRVWGAREFSL
jgi:molybdate transport system permease protein